MLNTSNKKIFPIIMLISNAISHGESPKMNLDQTRTMAVGRFIVTIPEQATHEWGGAGYNSAGRFIRSFEAASHEVVKEAYEHECESLKMKHGEVEPKYETSKIGTLPHSYRIHFWGFPSKRKEWLGVKSYYWKGSRGYIFENESAFFPEEILACEQSQDNCFNQLVPRMDSEIPEGPGFCFNRAFFRGEPPKSDPNEHIALHINFPGHPDVFMRFSTDVVRGPQGKEDGLLARSSRGANLVPGVTKLRARERKVGQRLGEELIKRVQQSKSVVGYIFTWEYNGPGKSASDPAIMLELLTGWADPAVNSSLTQEEAVAIWEKVLPSIRYRVQAQPRPGQTP